MKNVLTLKSELFTSCACIEKIADGTNRLFVNLYSQTSVSDTEFTFYINNNQIQAEYFGEYYEVEIPSSYFTSQIILRAIAADAAVQITINCENVDMTGEVTLTQISNNEYTLSSYVKVPDILKQVYPVGAIYISVNYIDLGSLFGGTWELLKDRFLLGAGNTYQAGTTGGSATHTLTVNEMPSHTHNYNRGGLVQNYARGDEPTPYGYIENGGVSQYNTTSSGGGQPHNNMPPYLVVYMWKRIA